jgi:O-antigen ligase
MIDGLGDTRFVTANPERIISVGRVVILVFALAFPLVTAPTEFGSNLTKFNALLVFAAFLAGIVMLFLYRTRSAVEGPGSTRMPFLIWLILGGYSFLLTGFCSETLVMVFTFLMLVSLWTARSSLTALIPPGLTRSLGILVAVVLISCFANLHQYQALLGHIYRKTGLVTFGCVVTLFVSTLIFLGSSGDCRRVLKCLLLGGGLVSAVGLLQFFGTDIVFLQEASFFSGWRSYGTMGNPNWFGTYLLLLLPIAVGFYLESGRLWAGAACGLLYANILTSQTRGAWLATAAFAVMVFVGLRGYRRRTRQLLLLLVVITAFLLPCHELAILQRADSLRAEADMALTGSNEAGTARFQVWKFAVRKLPAHFLVGSGLDTLGSLGSPEDPAPNSKAHSIFVEYAVTIGIPGLLLYLAFLWKGFSGATPDPISWAFRALFLVYLIQGIFIHDTIQAWPLIWFLAALAVRFREPSVRDLPTVSADIALARCGEDRSAAIIPPP